MFDPVGAEDIARFSGAKGYASRYFASAGGAVHPLKLARGLAHAAEQAGVRRYGGRTILPAGCKVQDTRRLTMYARRGPEPGNRLVFGGIGFRDPLGRVCGFDWLRANAARTFPGVGDCDWPCAWGGQMAMTHDRIPHLHEMEPGLLWPGLAITGVV